MTAEYVYTADEYEELEDEHDRALDERDDAIRERDEARAESVETRRQYDTLRRDLVEVCARLPFDILDEAMSLGRKAQRQHYAYHVAPDWYKQATLDPNGAIEDRIKQMIMSPMLKVTMS